MKVKHLGVAVDRGEQDLEVAVNAGEQVLHAIPYKHTDIYISLYQVQLKVAGNTHKRTKL